MILFVKLAEGEILSDDLRKRIRDEIRKKRSPRHCPEKVFAYIPEDDKHLLNRPTQILQIHGEIPHTLNGKRCVRVDRTWLNANNSILGWKFPSRRLSMVLPSRPSTLRPSAIRTAWASLCSTGNSCGLRSHSTGSCKLSMSQHPMFTFPSARDCFDRLVACLVFLLYHQSPRV